MMLEEKGKNTNMYKQKLDKAFKGLKMQILLDLGHFNEFSCSNIIEST